MDSPDNRLTTFHITLMVIEWSAIAVGVIMVMAIALMRT